jgi:hypothetical protein
VGDLFYSARHQLSSLPYKSQNHNYWINIIIRQLNLMKELGKYQSIELTIELAVKNGEQKHHQKQPEVAADGYTNLAKRELKLQLIHTVVIER